MTLTEREVEGLALQLERRSRDHPKLIPGPGAGRGRPKLDGGMGHSPKRAVRLPEALDERYAAAAAAAGKTVSQVIREVLTKHAPKAR